MTLRHFLAPLLAVVIVACAPVRERREEAPTPPAGAWSQDALDDLVETARAAPQEGLPAEDAAMEEIALFRGRAAADAAATAQLDLAADALFATLARTLARGATEPTTADPEWRIPAPSGVDVAALLARRTAGEMPSELLRALAPQSADYRALRDELTRVSAEPAGQLDASDRTREARIDSLRATLERWRWLPRDLPATRVEVRLPHFEAALVRDGATAQVHAAIVGARATPTPSFAAEIRSVTLNPYWEPPASIALGELLPRFRRNPAAAARENFEALDAQGRSVALSSIDWTARPFPYRLRQRPGAGNALGRIRFDLPNPYAVFLHDTPSRSLFARADRALSHGCIRVQNPVDFAAAVLGSAQWDAAALNARIDQGVTEAIALDSPMPIYVLYLTAVPRPDGAVAYADDLYGRDRGVVAALDAPDVTLAAERAAAPLRCRG